MRDSPIEHVADTAFWVATYRADESARADALFRDPLAARLALGRGREIAAKMPRLALAEWLVVIRTCIIDDFVRDAVRAGADTILNLGAGLDTRPYRLDLPPALRWIEVDFEDTIAFKSERLARETPRCALERVSVDLGEAGARRALLAKIAAESRRVFVLTEGVIPYLANDAVAELADDLRAAPCFAAWTLEYMTPLADRTSRRMRSHIRFARAPFQFQPGDWRAFFRAHGWEIAQMRYLVEEGARLGRRPPLTCAQRMMLSLASPEKRKALREMRGFALLGRADSAPEARASRADRGAFLETARLDRRATRADDRRR